MAPTEEEKLKIRIEHWIEHNADHAAEFKELSDAIKTGKSGNAAVDLMNAAEEIERANKWLREALKKIGRH